MLFLVWLLQFLVLNVTIVDYNYDVYLPQQMKKY